MGFGSRGLIGVTGGGLPSVRLATELTATARASCLSPRLRCFTLKNMGSKAFFVDRLWILVLLGYGLFPTPAFASTATTFTLRVHKGLKATRVIPVLRGHPVLRMRGGFWEMPERIPQRISSEPPTGYRSS